MPTPSTITFSPSSLTSSASCRSSRRKSERAAVGRLHFGQLLNGLVVPVPLKGNFYIQDLEAALPTGELKDRLSDALTSEWFGYTHAFMNMVKHHQLVVHNASISFVDENRRGKFEGFTHKKKDYPAYWVQEAREGTVWLQNSLQACGVLLITCTLEKATPHLLGSVVQTSSTTKKQKTP